MLAAEQYLNHLHLENFKYFLHKVMFDWVTDCP